MLCAKTMNLKSLFEAGVAAARFKMLGIYQEVYGSEENREHISSLGQFFDGQEFKHFLQAIIRFSFFIEPVNLAITTTKFSVRWSAISEDDPRYASYDECANIFKTLLADLIDAISEDAERRELLMVMAQYGRAYEINLDYIERKHDEQIHSVDNIEFFWGELPEKAYKLRKYLLTSGNTDQRKAFKAAYDKIAV